MDREAKIYTSILCGMSIVIGFFFGLAFEQSAHTITVEKNITLTKDVEYWKGRWRDQDSVLQKISNQPECTFKTRSIIGELE